MAGGGGNIAPLSFAEDMWDAFSVVGKWEQQGITMCKVVSRFNRKRAKIEEAYGKGLLKLVQQINTEIQEPGSYYCKDVIYHGSLGVGWEAACRTVQMEGELHCTFAEQIRNHVVDSLINNTVQLEEQLKQVIKEGERLLLDHEQWLSNLKKIKHVYYKAVKEAEAAKSTYDESMEFSKTYSSKSEKKVQKISQEAQAAELAYLGQIKHTNFFMNSFYNELMPRVMQRLEDIERSRQELLVQNFRELSHLAQELPNGVFAEEASFAKTVTQVDVLKDLQELIQINRTTQGKPPPFQYEPLQDEYAMDAYKKGKTIFTFAKKLNSNIFGSPKNVALSSLSPSSSVVLLSKAKPFKFAVFGVSLEEIMTNQRDVLPDLEVPYFLLVLALDALKSNAPCLEGVFRSPAPSSEIDALTRQFDAGNYDLSSIQSPYVTTHLIKKWCRDLPDPLIPSYLYERCIACTNRDEVNAIMPLVPPLYHKVVMFIAQLLHEFSRPTNSQHSKMTSTNFAMVFSPSFLRCSSTDMADFLLNVHREKSFVQTLIDSVEERISIAVIEHMMAPADDVLYSKETPKWQYSVRPSFTPSASVEHLDENGDFKVQLMRQDSEREMLYVKQQQLRKILTSLNEPDANRYSPAEKEKSKEKSIKVMRNELQTTLQEKERLEDTVRDLSRQVERLAQQLDPSTNSKGAAAGGVGAGLTGNAPSQSLRELEDLLNFSSDGLVVNNSESGGGGGGGSGTDALSALLLLADARENGAAELVVEKGSVKENIRNYEQRATRSGSDPPSVVKAPKVVSPRQRSMSPPPTIGMGMGTGTGTGAGTAIPARRTTVNLGATRTTSSAIMSASPPPPRNTIHLGGGGVRVSPQSFSGAGSYRSLNAYTFSPVGTSFSTAAAVAAAPAPLDASPPPPSFGFFYSSNSVRSISNTASNALVSPRNNNNRPASVASTYSSIFSSSGISRANNNNNNNNTSDASYSAASMISPRGSINSNHAQFSADLASLRSVINSPRNEAAASSSAGGSSTASTTPAVAAAVAAPLSAKSEGNTRGGGAKKAGTMNGPPRFMLNLSSLRASADASLPSSTGGPLSPKSPLSPKGGRTGTNSPERNKNATTGIISPRNASSSSSSEKASPTKKGESKGDTMPHPHKHTRERSARSLFLWQSSSFGDKSAQASSSNSGGGSSKDPPSPTRWTRSQTLATAEKANAVAEGGHANANAVIDLTLFNPHGGSYFTPRSPDSQRSTASTDAAAPAAATTTPTTIEKLDGSARMLRSPILVPSPVPVGGGDTSKAKNLQTWPSKSYSKKGDGEPSSSVPETKSGWRSFLSLSSDTAKESHKDRDSKNFKESSKSARESTRDRDRADVDSRITSKDRGHGGHDAEAEKSSPIKYSSKSLIKSSIQKYNAIVNSQQQPPKPPSPKGSISLKVRFFQRSGSPPPSSSSSSDTELSAGISSLPSRRSASPSVYAARNSPSPTSLSRLVFANPAGAPGPSSVSPAVPISPPSPSHSSSAPPSLSPSPVPPALPEGRKRRTLSFPTNLSTLTAGRHHAAATAAGTGKGNPPPRRSQSPAKKQHLRTKALSQSSDNAVRPPSPSVLPPSPLSTSPPSSSLLLSSSAPARDSFALGTKKFEKVKKEVEATRKEVHARLCECVHDINATDDYTRTIEISKDVLLMIKCLDSAVSKLRIDEKKLAVALRNPVDKLSLPEVKGSSAENAKEKDSEARLRKLREVLCISLERILEQMTSLAAFSASSMSHDEAELVTQTLEELQVFLLFSAQDQAVTKIAPQDIVDGIIGKIEHMKAVWGDLPMDQQVEQAKNIVSVKKDVDDFCAAYNIPPTLSHDTQSSNMPSDTKTERITKTIYLTLDKIHSACLGVLKQLDARPHDNQDKACTDKLLAISRALNVQ